MGCLVVFEVDEGCFKALCKGASQTFLKGSIPFKKGLVTSVHVHDPSIDAGIILKLRALSGFHILEMTY